MIGAFDPEQRFGLKAAVFVAKLFELALLFDPVGRPVLPAGAPQRLGEAFGRRGEPHAEFGRVEGQGEIV
ncbi:hypothetical protein LRS10_02060 [Phenylobacterium sp. J426]|uniref:hypothetical protein n=1 Tax=Phenylobacterium sp. J426 TaxID=2898439 RepID=UPI0021516481|nr:hypothetical protein [Phenylobacterium sp. J426]MCR5873086.1 hypothetical protein [Phenylobacterium sp. J426]